MSVLKDLQLLYEDKSKRVREEQRNRIESIKELKQMDLEERKFEHQKVKDMVKDQLEAVKVDDDSILKRTEVLGKEIENKKQKLEILQPQLIPSTAGAKPRLIPNAPAKTKPRLLGGSKAEAEDDNDAWLDKALKEYEDQEKKAKKKEEDWLANKGVAGEISVEEAYEEDLLGRRPDLREPIERDLPVPGKAPVVGELSVDEAFQRGHLGIERGPEHFIPPSRDRRPFPIPPGSKYDWSQDDPLAYPPQPEAGKPRLISHQTRSPAMQTQVAPPVAQQVAPTAPPVAQRQLAQPPIAPPSPAPSGVQVDPSLTQFKAPKKTKLPDLPMATWKPKPIQGDRINYRGLYEEKKDKIAGLFSKGMGEIQKLEIVRNNFWKAKQEVMQKQMNILKMRREFANNPASFKRALPNVHWGQKIVGIVHAMTAGYLHENPTHLIDRYVNEELADMKAKRSAELTFLDKSENLYDKYLNVLGNEYEAEASVRRTMLDYIQKQIQVESNSFSKDATAMKKLAEFNIDTQIKVQALDRQAATHFNNEIVKRWSAGADMQFKKWKQEHQSRFLTARDSLRLRPAIRRDIRDLRSHKSKMFIQDITLPSAERLAQRQVQLDNWMFNRKDARKRRGSDYSDAKQYRDHRREEKMDKVTYDTQMDKIIKKYNTDIQKTQRQHEYNELLNEVRTRHKVREDKWNIRADDAKDERQVREIGRQKIKDQKSFRNTVSKLDQKFGYNKRKIEKTEKHEDVIRGLKMNLKQTQVNNDLDIDFAETAEERRNIRDRGKIRVEKTRNRIDKENRTFANDMQFEDYKHSNDMRYEDVQSGLKLNREYRKDKNLENISTAKTSQKLNAIKRDDFEDEIKTKYSLDEAKDIHTNNNEWNAQRHRNRSLLNENKTKRADARNFQRERNLVDLDNYRTESARKHVRRKDSYQENVYKRKDIFDEKKFDGNMRFEDQKQKLRTSFAKLKNNFAIQREISTNKQQLDAIALRAQKTERKFRKDMQKIEKQQSNWNQREDMRHGYDLEDVTRDASYNELIDRNKTSKEERKDEFERELFNAKKPLEYDKLTNRYKEEDKRHESKIGQLDSAYVTQKAINDNRRLLSDYKTEKRKSLIDRKDKLDNQKIDVDEKIERLNTETELMLQTAKGDAAKEKVKRNYQTKLKSYHNKIHKLNRLKEKFDYETDKDIEYKTKEFEQKIKNLKKVDPATQKMLDTVKGAFKGSAGSLEYPLPPALKAKLKMMGEARKIEKHQMKKEAHQLKIGDHTMMIGQFKDRSMTKDDVKQLKKSFSTKARTISSVRDIERQVGGFNVKNLSGGILGKVGAVFSPAVRDARARIRILNDRLKHLSLGFRIDATGGGNMSEYEQKMLEGLFSYARRGFTGDVGQTIDVITKWGAGDYNSLVKLVKKMTFNNALADAEQRSSQFKSLSWKEKYINIGRQLNMSQNTINKYYHDLKRYGGA